MVFTHSPPAPTEDESPTKKWVNFLPVLIAVVLTGIVVWPLLDNMRVVADRVWIPSGDWAVEGLRALDVGVDTPLLGPYSRFGWNHPGPLLFVVLALPLRLLDTDPNGLLIAALGINTLSVIGCAIVAWRRGRLLTLSITLAVFSLLLLSLGATFLQDPWNPFITILPFAFFSFAFWSISEGDWKLWPFALVAGSFILQSHLGYGPFVITVAISALLIAKRQNIAITPKKQPQRRIFFIVNGLVLFFCWLPVLIDLLFVSHNAQNIVSYFFSNDEPNTGLWRGIEIAAGQLRLHDSPWLGYTETATSNGAITGGNVANLLLVVALWLVAFWLSKRFQLRTTRRLLILSAVLIGTGIIATAQITGPAFSYLVRWWWVIAAIFWIALLCTVVGAIYSAFFSSAPSTQDRGSQLTPTRPQLLFQVVVVAICAIVIWQASGKLTDSNYASPSPDASSSEVLTNFIDPTVEAMQGLGPVLVVSTGSVWGNYADALRFALERSGTPVATFADTGYRFGDFRAEREVESTLWVVNADAANEWATSTRFCRLGYWDPLTPTERAAYLKNQEQLIAQFNAAGRSDLAYALKTGEGGIAEKAAELGDIDLQLFDAVERESRKGLPVATYTNSEVACARSLTY